MIKLKRLLVLFSVVLLIHWTALGQSGAPFYNIKVDSLGQKGKIDFSNFKGKKVLIVSVGTKDAYYSQIQELKLLGEHYRNSLVIVLCPTNDFNSEDGTDSQIGLFLYKYNNLFHVTTKMSVKGNTSHELYKLIRKDAPQVENFNKAFGKVLLNENGQIVRVFSPAEKPMGTEFIKAIEK